MLSQSCETGNGLSVRAEFCYAESHMSAPAEARRPVETPERPSSDPEAAIDRALDSGVFEAVKDVMQSERDAEIQVLSSYAEIANDLDAPDLTAAAQQEAQAASAEMQAAWEAAAQKLTIVFGETMMPSASEAPETTKATWDQAAQAYEESSTLTPEPSQGEDLAKLEKGWDDLAKRPTTAEASLTAQERVAEKEQQIEDRLRQIQGMIYETAGQDMPAAERTAAFQKIEALQRQNVGDWDEVRDLSANTEQGLVARNEALNDVQSNVTDMLKSLERLTFNPALDDASRTQAHEAIMGKMQDNLAHWDLINKTKSGKGPSESEGLKLKIEQGIEAAGSAAEAFIVSVERGEMAPGTKEPEAVRLARERAGLDGFAGRINAAGEEMQQRYPGPVELMAAQSALDGARLRLEEAKQTGADAGQLQALEGEVANAQAAAEAAEAAHPDVDMHRIIDVGVPFEEALEQGEAAREEKEEHPELAERRKQIGEIAEEMTQAEEKGDGAGYEDAIRSAIDAKQGLADELRKLPAPTEAQREELKRLEVEIAQHEKELDLREGKNELSSLEDQKHELEVKLAELEASGASPEEIAAVKQELEDVDAKLKAKRSSVADLETVQGKYDDVLRSYGGVMDYSPAGRAKQKNESGVAGKIADTIVDGIHDPSVLAFALLDKLGVGKARH